MPHKLCKRNCVVRVRVRVSSVGWIDDNVIYGPPNIVFRELETYWNELKTPSGVEINRTKTKCYSASGDYSLKPEELQIGELTKLITDNFGDIREHKTNGLKIWGTAVSNDDEYIKTYLEDKTNKIRSTITKITKSLSFISPDSAMQAVRLSSNTKLQYFQQTHSPRNMESTNTIIEQTIHESMKSIMKIDLKDNQFFQQNENGIVQDPLIVYDSISLPNKYKGMGVRRANGFIGDVAYISAFSFVMSKIIDHKTGTAENNNIKNINGICPVLEDLLGQHSQDEENKEIRFEKLIADNSNFASDFIRSIELLKLNYPETQITDGPLKALSIAFKGNQKDVTTQIEKIEFKKIEERFKRLPFNDRRRICWNNRSNMSLAALNTMPSKGFEVPLKLYKGCCILALGAIDPIMNSFTGKTIGNTKNIVDIHGDAIANAHLPGGNWTISHDQMLKLMVSDAKWMGINARDNVYNLFNQYMCEEQFDQFQRMKEVKKKTISIVPDIVIINNTIESPLMTNGEQMYELKKIQAINKFNKRDGTLNGLNMYYKEEIRPNKNQMKATEVRAKLIPGGYQTKAMKADSKFPAGRSNVLLGLNQMQEVIPLVIGAIGELSDGVLQLMDGIAHEGAFSRASFFGQKNFVFAKALIKNWLHKRWCRRALISAVQMRQDGFRYVGGHKEAVAATIHQLREERVNVMDQIVRRNGEDEIQGLRYRRL